MTATVKSEVVHVRVPAAVLKRIKAQAAKEGRTLSGFIAWKLFKSFSGPAKARR